MSEFTKVLGTRALPMLIKNMNQKHLNTLVSVALVQIVKFQNSGGSRVWRLDYSVSLWLRELIFFIIRRGFGEQTSLFL